MGRASRIADIAGNRFWRHQDAAGGTSGHCPMGGVTNDPTTPEHQEVFVGRVRYAMGR